MPHPEKVEFLPISVATNNRKFLIDLKLKELMRLVFAPHQILEKCILMSVDPINLEQFDRKALYLNSSAYKSKFGKDFFL